MTLMGLTRSPNARFSGTAHYRDMELVGATEAQLRSVRGAEIAMIFQDPMTSLNPVHRIGDQIAEQIRAHEQVGEGAGARAVDRVAGTGGHPARARPRQRTTRTSSPAACASA